MSNRDIVCARKTPPAAVLRERTPSLDSPSAVRSRALSIIIIIWILVFQTSIDLPLDVSKQDLLQVYYIHIAITNLSSEYYLFYQTSSINSSVLFSISGPMAPGKKGTSAAL
jgi:hypothetical protein